jgi:hypothetical protein
MRREEKYILVLFFIILQKMCSLHFRNTREVTDYPNKQSNIRFGSTRIIRLFDPLSVSVRYIRYSDEGLDYVVL